MTIEAGSVVVRLIADLKDFTANMVLGGKSIQDFSRTAQGAQGDADGMANSIASGVKRAAVEIAAFVVGVKSIKEAFVTVIGAASQHQDATLQLEQALRRTGDASATNVTALENYAAALARTTPYTQNQIEESMAWALQMGINVNRIEDVSKAAAGLAYLMHADLQTGYTAILRAAEGYGQTLARHGIYINANASAEEQANQVLQEGLRIYPDLVERTTTASGAYDQMTKAVKQSLATIGTEFLPILTEAGRE